MIIDITLFFITYLIVSSICANTITICYKKGYIGDYKNDSNLSRNSNIETYTALGYITPIGIGILIHCLIKVVTVWATTSKQKG